MPLSPLKIFSAAQTRLADKATIEREPISSLQLMERASLQCAQWVKGRFSTEKKISVFCGEGNNGGDGLAIARLLQADEYAVDVFLVSVSGKRTPDNEANLARWMHTNAAPKLLQEEKDFPEIPSDSVVIDAIFGAGLSRPVSGLAAALINHINSAGTTILSVDVPSGLFMDEATGKDASVIKAAQTLSFQFPKLAFLLPENAGYVGEWHLLPIGLNERFIAETETDHYLLTKEYIASLLIRREKFSHKGSFGHALITAGSFGKIGAAVLAVNACLRSGAGLVSTHIPGCGYEIMQRTNPEAMCIVDKDMNCLTDGPPALQYSAVGIGPGIGTASSTAEALHQYITGNTKPMVLDADALNLISENKNWLNALSAVTVLTPHPKEFERMAGKSENHFERLLLQKDFSKRYKTYVILKGAHTAIAAPDGKVYFNSTGNPGMAKGGSGDVLTGIITGLLAQGYNPLHASLIGVYVHGLAGDKAAAAKGQIGMTAMDICSSLPEAWQSITPVN